MNNTRDGSAPPAAPELAFSPSYSHFLRAVPRSDLDALSNHLRDTSQLNLQVIASWLRDMLHDSVWRSSKLSDYLVDHALRDVTHAREAWREVLETAMRHPPHAWRIICSPLARTLPRGQHSLLEGLRVELLRPDEVSPAHWHARLRVADADAVDLALTMRNRPLSDAGIRLMKDALTRSLGDADAARARECLTLEIDRLMATGRRSLADLRELRWHLQEAGFDLPCGHDDRAGQATYAELMPALKRACQDAPRELCSLLHRIGRQAEIDQPARSSRPGAGHDTLLNGLIQAMLAGVTPTLSIMSVQCAMTGLSQLGRLLPMFASVANAHGTQLWPMPAEAGAVPASRVPPWVDRVRRSLDVVERPSRGIPSLGVAPNGTVTEARRNVLIHASDHTTHDSSGSMFAPNGAAQGALPSTFSGAPWLRTVLDGIELPTAWLPTSAQSNASGAMLAQMALAFAQVSLLEALLADATAAFSDAGLMKRFASGIDDRLAARFPATYNRTIGVAGYKVVTHVRRPGSVQGIGGPRPVNQRVEPGPAARREVTLWDAFRRNHDGSTVATEFAGDEDVLKYEPYLEGPEGPTDIAIDEVLREIVRYDLGAMVQRHVADQLRGQEARMADHGRSVFQFNVASAELGGNITAAAGEAFRAWAANGSQDLRFEGVTYRFRTLTLDDVPVIDGAIIEPVDLASTGRVESVFLYIPGRMDDAGDGVFNVVAGVLQHFESAAALVHALVEIARGNSPWHATLASAAPPHDVERFTLAMRTLAGARHPDAHIGGDTLIGDVWTSRARRFAEHVEACTKRAYVSNLAMEQRRSIRDASAELDTLVSIMSMVPVIGTVFEVASVVNDATRAYYESHFGDAEEGQQFHRSMLMNSFGAVLSVAQDVPFKPAVSKLLMVRLGGNKVMAARPLGGLRPDSKRAHQLKNVPMDPASGLRRYRGRNYMTVNRGDGREAYVRVELDRELGTYRVREALGVLKEPVRFDPQAASWSLDLNPWLNKASDLDVMAWMLTKPEHFQPDVAELGLMRRRLAILGATNDDLAMMARGGAAAERLVPAMAAVVADALPDYLDARLRRTGTHLFGSPVLRDIVHAELAKDLGETIIVLKPALGEGASSAQRFISGFGPDGAVLDRVSYGDIVAAAGARIEVQEIRPGVFLPEGAPSQQVPHADANLIHAVLLAKHGPGTGAAGVGTTASRSGDVMRGLISKEASERGNSLADALGRRPQEELVEQCWNGLVAGEWSRHAAARVSLDLMAFGRALRDAGAPLSRDMEARIIRSVLSHDGKGIAIEIEHVPASRAPLASQNSPGGEDVTRHGPRQAAVMIHLRAICDERGRATSYQHFNEASASYESARPWPGTPLLDALMAGNHEVLARQMRLDRYAMDQLAARLQQRAADAACFAELPSFAPHAIKEPVMLRRIDGCFRRNPVARSCLLDGRAYIQTISPSGKRHYFEIHPSQSDGVHQILRQSRTAVGKDTGLFISHSPVEGWRAKWLHGGAPELRSPADVGEIVRKLDGNVLSWVGRVNGKDLSLVYDLESCSWIKVEDLPTLRNYRQTVIDKSRLSADQRTLTPAEQRLQIEAGAVPTYMLDELQDDVFVEGQRFADRKASAELKSRGLELRTHAMDAFDIDRVLVMPETFRDSAAAVPLPARVFQIWVGDAEIPNEYLPRMKSVGRGVADALDDQPVRHEVYLSSPSRAVFDRNVKKLQDAVPDVTIFDLDTTPFMTTFRQQAGGQYAQMFDWAMDKKAWSSAADVLRFGLLADHVDKTGKCIRPGGGLYVDMDDAFHRPPTRDELSIAPSRALLGPATNNPDLDMRAIINTDCIGVHAGNPLPREVLDESWRRFERDPSFQSRPKPRPGTDEAEQYASERASILAGPRVLHHVLQQEPYLDPVAARRIQVSRMSTKEGVLPTTAMVKHAQDAAGLEFLEMGSENSWMNHR